MFTLLMLQGYLLPSLVSSPIPSLHRAFFPPSGLVEVGHAEVNIFRNSRMGFMFHGIFLSFEGEIFLLADHSEKVGGETVIWGRKRIWI